MIQPYFAYCNIIWGGATKLALHRLVCLQKRAIRLISNSTYRSPSTPLFRALGILKLIDLHKLQILIFMYKAKHKLLPFSCYQYIKFSNRSHRFNFRKEKEFEMLRFSTKLRQNSVRIVRPRLRYELPDNLKSIGLSLFKLSLVELSLRDYDIV